MSEEWEIACSDDEKYEVKQVDSGKWEPPPELIIKYYDELNSGQKYFELNWKCPGRRPPTPEKTDEQKDNENTVSETKSEEKDEYFDFEVDKGPASLRPSGEVGPRGSAKKKTTSLDAILSNMARHRRMDMMEEDPPEISRI